MITTDTTSKADGVIHYGAPCVESTTLDHVCVLQPATEPEIRQSALHPIGHAVTGRADHVDNPRR